MAQKRQYPKFSKRSDMRSHLYNLGKTMQAEITKTDVRVWHNGEIIVAIDSRTGDVDLHNVTMPHEVKFKANGKRREISLVKMVENVLDGFPEEDED